MSVAARDDAQYPPEANPSSTLDAVGRAALELLASLPDRPDRLRVSAADVTLDLDWRPPAAAPTAAPTAPLTAAPTAAPTDGAGQPVASLPDGSRQQAAEEGQPALHYVCAPSVGAFYSAPEPGARPFAAAGTNVNAGQQVAIIEVMKLMLPVDTDRPGRVVEVLIEDGQTVEFGERLLALAPAE
jgi:acetyl-CoA carboxylase biotin carboxyl carrier protein